MQRRTFLMGALAPQSRTVVEIEKDGFKINGRPTYEGRSFRGAKVEGLLMNSRMVQGIFDDRNRQTEGRWAYPDTGRWDAMRNTREFVAAMPEWRRHGLLSFTINLQGGSPQGYSKDQPWITGALRGNGTLRGDSLARLKMILDEADRLGMAPIVGIYYFGQDQEVRDEAAVRRGVRETVFWLLRQGYRNILLEINNECNVKKYEHEILRPARVHELIEYAKGLEMDKRRLLVGTSYGGGAIPTENVVRSSDFLLVHGNGVKVPARIEEMCKQTRAVAGYAGQPILFNEDDHFDFEQPENNCWAAVKNYVSWGYFDPGESNYRDGYQCPPVAWGINTERKKAFFGFVKEITGS
ncbi:MAG: hypothetical protein NW208_02675 [Bryobacter sp.]|nr:hypothetical protein [Bryobacter sp.]